MKIYTGTGDLGKTSLFSGERFSKANLRIEAYGDVDELNSVLGALAASIEKNRKNIINRIVEIQAFLFNIGAWLATTPDSPSATQLNNFSEIFIENLEQAIDQLDKELPPLNGFIIPGGSMPSAWAHVARTVCRRTERHVIRCFENEGTLFDENQQAMLIITYLNRLSDYLFTLGRYLNNISGLKDKLWKNYILKP